MSKAPALRPAPKKVFIRTYGCQMNVYDSERMTDALEPTGYVPVADAASADLILVNTCHIREKAAEKVYSELGRLKRLKAEAADQGRVVMIGVTGCVAQAEGAEIVRRAPVVDLVVGPQSYQRLPEILAEAAAGRRVVATDFAVAEKFAVLDRVARTRAEENRRLNREQKESAEERHRLDRETGQEARSGDNRDREVKQEARSGVSRDREAKRPPRYSAFLTVQEGCDKFCTFCVVPYTRGAEISRPVTAILDEAARLAESGVREVTLLGQNVNAWHGEGPNGEVWGLGRLLRRLAEVPGLDRLRYTTSHPRDMDDDLIAAHRDLDQLMPYLHLPVQSGSDRMLAAMNRRHSRADYMRLVERVRGARPDIALSGDFIVGFPGETEADFAETLSMVSEIGYAAAFSFKYSPRPGTPASDLVDQVSEAVKTERLQRLQAVIYQCQTSFNRSTVGRVAEVLFERSGHRAGQIVGRSPWLQPVQVDADAARIGTIGRVLVESLGTNSLYGRLVEQERLRPAMMEAIA